jgi:Regulator of ribonuclease activity B
VIEAFLYFTGEGAARRVAAHLEEGGYTTYVDPSPPGRWLLEAVSREVPTPEHIAAMGSGLRNLARSNNGLYDGWWASEPPEDEEGEATGVAQEQDLPVVPEGELADQPEGSNQLPSD